MSEKIRLSNDTVVDLDTVPTEQLVTLIGEREDRMLIEQRPERLLAMQGDIDRFLGAISLRNHRYSLECGDAD